MKNVLLKLIKIYQLTPLHCHCMCRFIPTCSQYAATAISEYGALKGSALAIKRICRCNPFGKFGIDEVKLRKEMK